MKRIRSSTLFLFSRLSVFALVFLIFGLTSCAYRGLVHVHDVYRAEFQAQLQKPNDAGPTPKPSESKFPETLNAIQAFRESHPQEQNALKHLAVLEAMVYLQSGNYGTARAAAKRADALPGSITTSKHNLLRDALFLEAMKQKPGLIEAFEMIYGGSPKVEEQLEQCGNNLSAVARQYGAVEGDSGAIHVASVAADCYLFALRQAVSRAVGTPEARERSIKDAKRKYGQAAMHALEPHLTAVEKTASPAERDSLAEWSPRYKYVRFYHIAQHERDSGSPPSP